MKTTLITITISGEAKSGKSGLAFAIAFFLRRLYDIPVRVIDDNGNGTTDEPKELMEKSYPARMTALAQRRTLVQIQTKVIKCARLSVTNHSVS